MKYDINGKYRYSYKKRKSEKVKKFIFYIIFSLMFVVVITILTNSELKKAMFYPKEIKISGLTYIENDELIKKFDLYNLSIIKLFKKKLKEKINSLYFIKDFKVKYRFFNIVEIEIYEKPIYFILYDPVKGYFYKISEDYTVLGIANDLNIINYVIITKKLSKVYNPGEKTDFKVDFFDKKEYFSKEAKVVSEIKYDINKLEAFFINTPYRVEMGDFIDSKKIKNFLMLKSLIKNPEKIDFVDFSFPDIGRIVEKEEENFNG